MTVQSYSPLSNASAASGIARYCPLCEGDNQCAIAQGEPAESCWCMHEDLDPRALAAIPAHAQNRRCICPGCGLSQGASVK